MPLGQKHSGTNTQQQRAGEGQSGSTRARTVADSGSVVVTAGNLVRVVALAISRAFAVTRVTAGAIARIIALFCAVSGVRNTTFTRSGGGLLVRIERLVTLRTISY